MKRELTQLPLTGDFRMTDGLQNLLKQLRLSGLLSTLEVRLHEAAANHLDHREFLELILHDELAVRSDRLLQRRVKAAQFREVKALDQFDWSFNPSHPQKADLRAWRRATSCVSAAMFCSWVRPGVGKSFLAQALGYHAIKAGFLVLYRSIFDLVRDFLHDELLGDGDKMLAKYLKPDLLIIDDMGMKQLPKRSGECLFEIVLRRYETRSTIMTSNRPLEDWGKLLGDVPSATAILDRFLHHADLIELKGKSYRLNHRSAVNNAAETEPEDARRHAKPAPKEGVLSDSKPASAKGALSDSKPATQEGRPAARPAKTKSLDRATVTKRDFPLKMSAPTGRSKERRCWQQTSPPPCKRRIHQPAAFKESPKPLAGFGALSGGWF